ncbi:MAG: hypothetical protein ACFCUM_00610 [Bacteroidales bacterium]
MDERIIIDCHDKILTFFVGSVKDYILFRRDPVNIGQRKKFDTTGNKQFVFLSKGRQVALSTSYFSSNPSVMLEV